MDHCTRRGGSSLVGDVVAQLRRCGGSFGEMSWLFRGDVVVHLLRRGGGEDSLVGIWWLIC